MQIWFLQSFDSFEKGVCDIHMSDYNLDAVRKLKFSPLRWIEFQGKVAPGSGSGTVKIAGKTFKVTYAWGGRNDSENYHIRTSYTVRLSGRGIENEFKKIREQIIIDESGSLTYEVPYSTYCKHKTAKAFRQEQERMAKVFAAEEFGDTLQKYFTPEKIDEAVREHKRKMKDPKAMVTLHHSMDTIETDMLEQRGKYKC
jgi:hypothetical protein